MGNGTSQSVMLGPSRSLGHSLHPVTRYQRSPAKYAHPNNRVLPKPVVGQRLRSTDNGHILHSAGTIRGLKSASPVPQDQEDGDPEVMGILRRRSKMIEKDTENCHERNFRNQRMFHSDPDISQSRPTTVYSPEGPESIASRRPCGAVAARTNKLKQRKKCRAPEPPPLESFPGHLQRRTQSSIDLTDDRNGDCRCLKGIPDWKKNRAPPPPPLNVRPQPPDPPPLPIALKTNSSQQENPDRAAKCAKSAEPLPSTAEPRLSGPRRDSTDNIKLSSSVGDLRLKDEARNTVFDSKADLSKPNSNSAHTPIQPDPFQKEIEAVTRKIAESRQKNSPVEKEVPKEPQKVTSPKQYYFSDRDVFKINASKPNMGPKAKSPVPETQNRVEQKELRRVENREEKMRKEKGLCNGESPLQRFSPDRRRIKSPSKNIKDENRHNGDHTHSKLSHNEDDSDIDVRLRPVLPRKTPELKKFSPSEAWRALGADDQGGTNRSTSDESVSYYRKHNNKFPNKREYSTFPEKAEHDAHSSYNCSLSESHWTPRQDLDDSDSSSLNSEDVVVPKSQLGEFSTRFSLPTVMFSNMRPIGCDLPSIKRTIHNYHDFSKEEIPKYKHLKKKPYKQPFANSDMNAASHFKKFLGMRNKYLSEEDVSVSDSNWTFGGCGLQQKRGKQYSSDLMLSDKKKYELVVKNNYGEFLGDVLVTKSNDIRNKTRHVDPGTSNFSFYSTEGHVMYLPKTSDCEDNSSSIRSKFDKTDEAQPLSSKNHRKFSELENSCSIDLVRMLEDDARRRRSKEKLCIRKQLQMMKQMDSEDDDTEEEVDEAYFTEPKSLEGSSPLQLPLTKMRYVPELRKDAFHNSAALFPLKHWTSSPALLDDHNGMTSGVGRGFLSSSSVTSSPDPVTWQKQPNPADRWFQRKQQPQNRRYIDKQRRISEGDSSPGLSRRDPSEKLSTSKEQRKATNAQVKEKKKTSIYKQLMDIVRKEERQLKKAQGTDYDLAASRESSYSQRESSHSSSSHDSVSSSYSDSSANGATAPPDCCGKSGVPANDEFHTSTSMGMKNGVEIQQNKKPTPFHIAFVQPFSPNKGYRPVPFDVAVPAAAGNCRMPTLQESHKFQAQVS